MRGFGYLVLALCSTAFGIGLVCAQPSALFGAGRDADDYRFIALMALSVACFWSCVKFVVINRRRADASPLLLILIPMLLASLYVTWEYVGYLIETYHAIHAFNSRYLVQ